MYAGWNTTGLLSAAAYSNREYVGDDVAFADDIELAEQDLLFDPQTSGGLLVACPADRAQEMLDLARRRLSTRCAIVGEVVERKTGAPVLVRHCRKTAAR